MTQTNRGASAQLYGRAAVLLAIFAGLTGCATVMNRPTQILQVSSTPSDAAVTITDETGAEVFRGMTPASVKLLKGDVGYFSKKSYAVTVDKEGFSAQTIPVVTTYSAWYVLGNLPLGGIIGWFLVDPLTGRLYKLVPGVLDIKLADRPAYQGTP
jgi:hypothetical protein